MSPSILLKLDNTHTLIIAYLEKIIDILRERNNMETRKAIIKTNTIELLENCDTSLKEIAKVIGVSPASISRWKKGLSIPKPEHLKKLAEALGKTENWLTINHEKKDDERELTLSEVRCIMRQEIHSELKLLLEAERKETALLLENIIKKFIK